MAPLAPPLHRVLSCLALVIVAVIPAVGCAVGRPGQTTLGTTPATAVPPVSSGSPSNPDQTTEPSRSSQPAPGTTPGSSSTLPATAGPTASPPPKLTLADYIARLPVFPPAPTPEAVVLPHAAGRAAWTSRIPTTQKVAFLTIDDGVVIGPDEVAIMKAAGIPTTLFLTTNTISAHKDFFAELEGAGAVIESHTVSHPNLTTLSYGQQRYELCHATDLLGEWYGRRPLFFRPPYGEKNDTTLRAAWECGLQAGFSWRETVNNGVVRFQTAEHVVQPGDIILMHFRKTFLADFVAALRAIRAAGLVPALLEDYVAIPLA